MIEPTGHASRATGGLRAVQDNPSRERISGHPMPTMISIASGKGGVGKSVIAANLSLLLAKQGKQVVLADLDVGGADAHVLFGLFHPPVTLTDFLNKRVARLDEVAQPVTIHPSLRLIAGTGDTLATANMPYARKKRLIRHFQDLQADVVVIDTARWRYTYVLDTAGDGLEVAFTESWVLDAVPRNPRGGPQPSQGSGQRLITLTTCAELFHTDERLVAFGHLVDRSPRG